VAPALPAEPATVEPAAVAEPAPERIAVAAPEAASEDAPAPLAVQPAAEAPAAEAVEAHAPAEAPVQPSVAAPAAAEPSAQPAPEPIEVPKAELESIVSGAGLEWVETKPRQLSFEDTTPVPAPRPARRRKPRATLPDEPLMQVETGQPSGGSQPPAG
jgi:hypothetical protein